MTSSEENPPPTTLSHDLDQLATSNNTTREGQGHPEPAAAGGVVNPYHFPEWTLTTSVSCDGLPVVAGPYSEDPLTRLRNLQALSMRTDDILIAAYPKSGTHWMNEIVHMLTSGRACLSERTKEHTQVDFVEDLALIEQEASPRVLNSHFSMAHLPRQIVDKKVKILHMLRNPKDVCVSHYHQLKQSASDLFNFDLYLKGYTTDYYLVLSHQFDYLRQMSEFEKAHPDHPIMHIHYEDLKKSPVPTILQLAQFLGLPASETFCQEVAKACSFDNMKKADQARKMPANFEALSSKRLEMYRKGVVGDWKNTFTVAQSEMFDQFMADQKKKGLAYTFRGQ